MKFNTNSNVYIIIYSVVMVVIVAILLTLAAVGLKPLQEENVLNDNKSQIVKALGRGTTPYNEVVDKAYLLDEKGNVVEQAEAKVFEALKDVKATREAKQFPIFVAKDGSVVVPLFGRGLWDAIWGFVALEPDMNTIKGIVLAHKGETPGLGAEIATDKHQAQYKGKTIFEGDQFVGVALMKGGADPNNLHEVDAISGGTKTSDGVTAMIKECLVSYEPYFKANKANKATAVVAPQAEVQPKAEPVQVETTQTENKPVSEPASAEIEDEPVVEPDTQTEPTSATPVEVETAVVEGAQAEQNTNDLNVENNG
jgi:Na+-transporting NADH:ubiquinone oxidoreductase subunit C